MFSSLTLLLALREGVVVPVFVAQLSAISNNLFKAYLAVT